MSDQGPANETPDLATDLALLARRPVEPATAPTVAELRSRLAARARRRRRLAAGAVLAVGLLAAVAAVAAWPSERVRVDAGPAEDPPTPTATPTPTPTSEPEPGTAARLEPDPQPEPEPYPQPDPGVEDWSVLVPGGDWTPIGVHTQADVWAATFSHRSFWAGTEDGPFGPVIFARFNPGLETRDYGDGPQLWHEVDSPGGITVRVGTDGPPNQLTGIFVVEDGSIAAQTFDLDEAELLAIVDDLAVEGLRVVHRGAELPRGLQQVTFGDARSIYSTAVTARRNEQQQVQVRAGFGTHWDPVLVVRTIHPDAEPFDWKGYRGLVHGADGLQDPGAVLFGPDRSYTITATPADESSEPMTADEIMAVVESLELWTPGELEDAFDLRPRAEIYAELLAENPLPPGHGLDWLEDGPAIDEFVAVREAQQVFACVWVGRWVSDGDPAALDTIETAADWPVSQRVRELEISFGLDPEFAGQLDLEEGLLDEARALTTPAARVDSGLRQSCAWWLGEN